MLSRVLILFYGIAAYAAFFVTILYGIGFVSGIAVPKTIDSGGLPGMEPLSSVLIDLAVLALFGITHSTMARPGFKKKLTRMIPVAAERSTFVLVASLQLGLVFFLWQPLPIVLWQISHTAFVYAGIGISLVGWVVVFWSSFLIDHFDLFGLRQVWLNFKETPYSHSPFMVRGLYKMVRHPLMTGFMMAFWITPTMTLGHLLFALVMTVYIIIGVALEEKDLERALGEDYIAYKKSTPMFFPLKLKR